MRKITYFTGLLWGQNSGQPSVLKQNSFSKCKLKLLERDTVSFTGSKQIEEEPYKEINAIADEYFIRLKQNLQVGLDYLKSKVKGLKVNKLVLNNGAAGMARLVESKQPPGYSYEMDINTEADSSFEAALHEGYHILQFDRDTEAPFVQTQQFITSQVSENSSIRKKYENLTRTIVHEVVLPVYSRKKHEIMEEILNYFRHSQVAELKKINREGLFASDQMILPAGLKEFLSELPDIKHLEYIQSHAQIEIKAHQYCMSKNGDPIIMYGESINRDKIRDILAIRIYQEIVNMTKQEINSRTVGKTYKAA